MKAILESLRIDEILEYMSYGKLLLIVFLISIVIVYLIQRFFGEYKWGKYMPGLLMLIYGIVNLFLVDFSREDFINQAGLVNFVIGFFGGFSAILFALILGVYNKPVEEKKKRYIKKSEEERE